MGKRSQSSFLFVLEVEEANRHIGQTMYYKKTDKALSGALFDHCMVITGASGGMLGAAYYRELYLRKNKASQLTFTTQNIPKTLVKIY